MPGKIHKHNYCLFFKVCVNIMCFNDKSSKAKAGSVQTREALVKVARKLHKVFF